MRWPVGWEALGQWGVDVARIEPLAGGVANDVWGVRVYGRLAVGRPGARGGAGVGRVGGGRLLGRRVRGQAARRSPSGLSGGSASRDRTYSIEPDFIKT